MAGTVRTAHRLPGPPRKQVARYACPCLPPFVRWVERHDDSREPANLLLAISLPLAHRLPHSHCTTGAAGALGLRAPRTGLARAVGGAAHPRKWGSPLLAFSVTADRTFLLWTPVLPAANEMSEMTVSPRTSGQNRPDTDSAAQRRNSNDSRRHPFSSPNSRSASARRRRGRYRAPRRPTG